MLAEVNYCSIGKLFGGGDQMVGVNYMLEVDYMVEVNWICLGELDQ